jgi:HTH-type transcriptional regulator/antitoxin HigA
VGFARDGWSDPAHAFAQELTAAQPSGKNWRALGMKLLDLLQVDRDMAASLVEAYEAANYSIAPSNDPIAMIEFVLETRGLTRKDLEPFIGTRQRVWDIMEKRRRLTLPMIRRLSKGLNIPIDVLVQEYELPRQPPTFQPHSTAGRQHSARRFVVQP